MASWIVSDYTVLVRLSLKEFWHQSGNANDKRGQFRVPFNSSWLRNTSYELKFDYNASTSKLLLTLLSSETGTEKHPLLNVVVVMKDQIKEISSPSGKDWGPVELTYTESMRRCRSCSKKPQYYPIIHLKLDFLKPANFRENHIINYLSSLFQDELWDGSSNESNSEDSDDDANEQSDEDSVECPPNGAENETQTDVPDQTPEKTPSKATNQVTDATPNETQDQAAKEKADGTETTEPADANESKDEAALPAPNVTSNDTSNETSNGDEDSSSEEDYISGDVKFIVNKETIMAHSTIVAAASPVLAAMLAAKQFEIVPVTQSSDSSLFNHMKVIRIDEIGPFTFRRLLRFMYTANLSEFLGSERELSQRSLFKAADKYQMESLKERVLQELKCYLSKHNVVDYLVMAHQHAAPELLEHALEFVVENKKEVWEEPGWKEFMQKHPDLFFLAMHRMVAGEPPAKRARMATAAEL